jgi:hypothetical protein
MEQSTPARIARLTAAAQRSRPQLRSLLDTWGAPYSKVLNFHFSAAFFANLPPRKGCGIHAEDWQGNEKLRTAARGGMV